MCHRCEMVEIDNRLMDVCTDCRRLLNYDKGIITKVELEESYNRLLMPTVQEVEVEKWNKVPEELKGTTDTGLKYLLVSEYRGAGALHVIYEHESFKIGSERK